MPHVCQSTTTLPRYAAVLPDVALRRGIIRPIRGWATLIGGAMPVTDDVVTVMRQRVAAQHDSIVQFMRDIVAIPSHDSQIGPVCERVGAEMRRLGFNEVRFDRMGNLVGRIGDGPRTLLYDTHVDTVGIGDPDAWEWDP